MSTPSPRLASASSAHRRSSNVRPTAASDSAGGSCTSGIVPPLGTLFWSCLQPSRSAKPADELQKSAVCRGGWPAALAAGLVASQFAVLDATFRGVRVWWAEPRVVLAVATSVALGLALVLLARARVLRAALALVASALLVLQILVFRYYHTPVDVQVVASAIHSRHDVRQVLLR